MSEKEKEPMFSAKIWKLLTSPFNQSNPITVQILGICSALAVTAKLKPAFVMALSVIVVTAFVFPIVYLPLEMIGDEEKIIFLGILSLVLNFLVMYCFGLDRREREILIVQLRKICGIYK